MRSIFSFALLVVCCAPACGQRQAEYLQRGVVALPHEDGVFVSWRLLGNDPQEVAFNVYRTEAGGAPERVNAEPLEGATCLLDTAADVSTQLAYDVRPIIDGSESAASAQTAVWQAGYLEIPLQLMPDYRPGDASIGDLDGDGQLDIVLHQVSRARDNGSAGITSEPILDAYRLDGTHLWRINLGKNVREGEHYTQFMVYDLDGDGRAEVACKTADGTIDGKGNVIGDGNKDWRTLQEGSRRHGRILDGPEYFTIFDGQTGAALKTVDYIPDRQPINGWGGIGGNAGNDSYGNRCDRFLACVAYLDGRRPSVVMCRGVYGRIVMVAWDWRDGKLTERWKFDTGASYPPYRDASPFAGMGGHSLSVGDVDADGRDEIVYQAMVVDDNGKGLYSTGLRHGDAMHLTDIDPDRPGMEVFTVQENENDAELFQTPGAAMRDARTGEILWSHSPTVDVTSGLAADVDPTHRGMEAWGGPGGLRTARGEQIGTAPRQIDWCIWWDGDPLRELLSCGRDWSRWRRRWEAQRARSRRQQPVTTASERGPREDRDELDTQAARRGSSQRRRPRSATPTRVLKWNWQQSYEETIFACEAVAAGRGPALVGDLIGDWREEILLVAPDQKSLRLYSTNIPTELRLTTLLHDSQYRLGLAWQNVVYNKPSHTSFFLGHQMQPPPQPMLNVIRPNRTE